MPFDKLIAEVRFTFASFAVFRLFLRLSLVFLVAYLVFAAIGIPWPLTIIPIIAYGVWMRRKLNKTDPFVEIEQKYPLLSEKLRAARDNTDEGNVFIFDLHKDVVRDIQKVRASSFFNTKKTRDDIIMIGFFAFMIIFLAPFHVQLFDFNVDIVNLDFDARFDIFGEGSGGNGGDSGFDPSEGGGAAFRDIYGESSIAVLGDEKVDVQLQLADAELDFTNIRAPEEREFQTVYPDDIEAVASSSFNEEIPQEQQEIVKNYYQFIAEG